MLKKVIILSCISLSIIAGQPKNSTHPYLQLLVTQNQITKKAANTPTSHTANVVYDYKRNEQRTTHEWHLTQTSKKRKNFTDISGNILIKDTAGTYIKMTETKPL